MKEVAIFVGKVTLGALIAMAIHQKFVAPMLAPKVAIKA